MAAIVMLLDLQQIHGLSNAGPLENITSIPPEGRIISYSLFVTFEMANINRIKTDQSHK